LMELGLYQAFESILITYASLVVAWVGSVVADLVINKPLGLSPRHIEFRRGHLYDINPVGVVSMCIASFVGVTASLGWYGQEAKALAAFMALSIPFVTVPFIAWLTNGRFYLSRPVEQKTSEAQQQCCICEHHFDHEDMSSCPSYKSTICSLCCALDSRCGDLCRPQAHLAAQASRIFSRILPSFVFQRLHSVTGHFLGIFVITGGIIAALLTVVFYAQQNKSLPELTLISGTLWQVFFLLMLITGVLIWLYVLAQKSARFALKETQFQTELLGKEVNAHQATAVELAQARDVANAANLAKSRYLSGVSHELRTPLNTIFGYTQLMEADTQLENKNRKIASVIRRSSEHLSDVIEGLLEISKIEARKFDLQRDTVDIYSLIKQLEDMFRPLAESKGIQFEIKYPRDLIHYVYADEKRLRQVLLNLLSNAIKFTPKGKVELHINYRNQVARMTVKDTGVGIAETDQQKIFEPFERLHDSQTPLISGTGLGLSISRLLVEMMGGNLELKSEPGVGSEFCLSLFLPVVTGDIAVKQYQKEVQGYTGTTQHILVVDDELRHRTLIYDFLHPLGFIVHMAESGAQALEMLKQQSVDLLLLDISMPGMDGWTLLHQLRQQGITAPVIILSADPYEDAKIKNNTEFQAYINKPLRLEKLLEQLQRCLDIQWCDNEDNNTTYNNQPQESIAYQKSFDTLRDYAKIGYLQGVLECTEQIEKQNPNAHLVTQLRKMADQCDLNGIVCLVDELQG